MSRGQFSKWLLTEGDLSAEERRKLIAISGRIRPVIKGRIHQEISQNLKELSEELTKAFYHAFYGKKGPKGEAHTVWEFSLSPKPIAVGSDRINIGSAVIAYQLPDGDQAYREPDLTQEEKEKFIRDRSKFFADFLRNTVLKDETLEEVTDDFVQKIYSAIEDEAQQGDKAQILWKGNIVGGNAKKNMGRILLALKLQPGEEKALEKVVREEPKVEPKA